MARDYRCVDCNALCLTGYGTFCREKHEFVDRYNKPCDKFDEVIECDEEFDE